jgi:hypothetical protein
MAKGRNHDLDGGASASPSEDNTEIKRHRSAESACMKSVMKALSNNDNMNIVISRKGKLNGQHRSKCRRVSKGNFQDRPLH